MNNKMITKFKNRNMKIKMIIYKKINRKLFKIKIKQNSNNNQMKKIK